MVAILLRKKLSFQFHLNLKLFDRPVNRAFEKMIFNAFHLI